MHAFGEVRYCARDVLQMVEDAVREAIIRLATSAHASSDGLNILSVSQVICGDARAVARMNQSLKASHVETRVQPRERTWDILSDFCLGEKLNVADIHAHCSWRALHAFRASMTTQEFQDFAMCRSVTLVRQTSRSRASRVRGMQRIILFREWLSLPKEWEVSDDVLHALGHIAWESIGELTQTALTVRYFDDLKKGHADPRSSGWTHGRHLIAAVAYGLGTGIMVPLTEVQAAGLRNEMDAFMSGGAARWRGYVYASSRCLLPCHVTEALRRLESRHESIFSREGSGHGLFGGS